MMTLLLSSSSLWCLSAVAIRPMDDEKRQCVNTKQGLHHITDDNGYTCDWFDVFPPTGCCPPEKAIEKRYGCSACDLAKGGETEKCCGTYESCVSCCQNATLGKFNVGGPCLDLRWFVLGTLETLVSGALRCQKATMMCVTRNIIQNVIPPFSAFL